jgi:hypothetical protein
MYAPTEKGLKLIYDMKPINVSDFKKTLKIFKGNKTISKIPKGTLGIFHNLIISKVNEKSRELEYTLNQEFFIWIE